MKLEETTEIPISGRKIRFVGANHGIELDRTLQNKSDFSQRKDEYTREINESDFIILEQPLVYLPENSKQNINFYNTEFFGKIGEIAYQKGRQIYICDPLNFEAYLLDLELNSTNDIGLDNPHKSNKHRLHKWRDLVIADQINGEILKLDFNNALSIHGANHNEGIIGNLLMPNSTKEELRKFKKFNDVGLMKIRRYTPSNNLSEISKYGQSWIKEEL
jgi:hypothetical protein